MIFSKNRLNGKITILESLFIMIRSLSIVFSVLCLIMAAFLYFTQYINSKEKRFEAVYFDRSVENPKKISDRVAEIAIHYSHRDRYPRINPHNFAGSWKGILSFGTSTRKQIQISQGHSDTVVKINGKKVFEGDSFGDFVHTFAPGEHEIEVFHVNNWHVVDFKVTIVDEVKKFTKYQLQSYFHDHDKPMNEIVYVGAYGSGSNSFLLNVELSDQDKGKIIWLDSHEAIDWQIKNDPGIAGVIVASYAPGSRVLGLNEGVPIAHSKDLVGFNSGSEVKCSCVVGTFHCYGRGELAKLENEVFQVTGAKLVGYAGSKSNKKIRTRKFDDKVRTSIKRMSQKIDEAEETCVKSSSPNFQKIFSSN